MENKKILIVEDEHSQREALKLKLEMEGFIVLLAKNGEEGLEVALKDHPNVVLLDIMMPKMDGVEMVKEIRKDEWGKNVPMVVLSNNSDITKIQQILENGVFEYFVKSDTKMEEIAEKIKEFAR